MDTKSLILTVFLGLYFSITPAYGRQIKFLPPASPSLYNEYNNLLSNKNNVNELDERIESLKDIAYDSDASDNSKMDLAAFLMLKVYHQIQESYEENEQLLSEASDLVPDSDRIEELWGDTCYYNGDYESSIIHYETALSLNPDNDTLDEKFGESYYRSLHYEKALEYIEKVLDKKPDSYQFLSYAGNCEYELNNYKGSIAYYERALELDLDENQKKSIVDKLEKAKNSEASSKDSIQDYDSHFMMSFEGNSKEILGDMPSESLNDVYDEVTKLLDCYPEVRINVIFFLTENYYKNHENPKWSGGSVDKLTIRVPLKTAYKKEFVRGALAHEFTHTLINLKTHKNAPMWVHEGLAQYQEYRTNYGSEKILREDFVPIYENEFLKNNFFIQLDNVPNYMASKDTNDVNKAYIISWLAIRYIIEKYGENSVGILLSLLSKGKDIKEAVSDVTDDSYEEFEKRLKKWITNQE